MGVVIVLFDVFIHKKVRVLRHEKNMSNLNFIRSM